MTEELNVAEEVKDDFEQWMDELDSNTEERNPETESVEEVEEDGEVQNSEVPETEEPTDEEKAEVDRRQFILDSDEDVVQIGDSQHTTAELKKLISDYNNDTNWKQKNEERGRKLNQAEKLQAMMESDPEYAKYVSSYQDSRARELSEYYDPETASTIRKLEIDNQTLQQKVLVREAEELYTTEQGELLTEGVHQEDILSAYDVLSRFNSQFYQANGRPMTLREAYGHYLANGGYKTALDRALKNKTEDTKKKEVASKKSIMPRDIGNSFSSTPASRVADDPLNDDIWQDEIFKNIPLQ